MPLRTLSPTKIVDETVPIMPFVDNDWFVGKRRFLREDKRFCAVRTFVARSCLSS